MSTGAPSGQRCGDRTLGDAPPDPEAAEELGQGSHPPPPRPLGALSTVGLLVAWLRPAALSFLQMPHPLLGGRRWSQGPGGREQGLGVRPWARP